MIKGYNGFLVKKLIMELLSLNEDVLFGSTNFIFKLKSLSKVKGKTGEIAQSIIDIIENEDYIPDILTKQNYFDTTDKDDMVSFLAYNKVPQDWDSDDDASLPYGIKGRGEIKIGKIIKTLVPMLSIGEVKDKDIEEFVNQFKASKNDTSMEFKLVSGSDISKYYNEKKYYSKAGSLGGSCMSDESKKTFRIYTENPKKVQLLIYVDNDDKVHGRALVWKLNTSPCDAKYFMDRIYTNRDSDEIKFKQFAEEKGFLYKKKNNAYIEDTYKFVYKGEDVFGEVGVKLDGNYAYYPFVDTMCFLDKDQESLSNLPNKGCYFLHSVSGDWNQCENCDGKIIDCYDCDDDGEFSCEKCDGDGEYEGKKCDTCNGKGDVKCTHKDADLCNDCGEGLQAVIKMGLPVRYNPFETKEKKKK
jgi:hypothetical protein